MLRWIAKVVGGSNEGVVKKMTPLINQINELEPEFVALSDEELRHKTEEFRARLAEGETLDDLQPEAFAAVREAAKRTIGQRHYDVQLIGGNVLHEGKIAEMRTGEGKTLVATCPIYLNALEGEGVHLITVNDYLVRRDAAWMGQIYHALGMTVGVIQHEASFLFDPEYTTSSDSVQHLRPAGKREAYHADITYGTNNEFGFDYLRDNMVVRKEQRSQRSLHYAIVDEVDNILIDEARTPLIISGQSDPPGDLSIYARIVRNLKRDADFEVDEKRRLIYLTDEGVEHVERMLNLPPGEHLYAAQAGKGEGDLLYHDIVHRIDQALKAEFIFKLDRDYVVKDGEVIIVDEFTGRLMNGRRYSDGLHQALEAKENVRVQLENKTLATITFQNYFRMYTKLAGMTGTASTEAEEFYKIYKLDVVIIPTNKEIHREDYNDRVYKTEKAKFEAVAEEIREMREEGRPVLVGTVSIEKSEHLSDLLNELGIPHHVLNAKQHEREAAIVAQAGQPSMVTIATNMAGRGTDIVLHPDVKEKGGLHIIGTERHESRRIDNQLRGRAGRQGDPGSSRFYVSLDDEIIRRFGGDRAKKMMERFNLPEDTVIETGIITKLFENSQIQVEGYNFDARKHVVEYDDVMNTQRKIIYEDRTAILEGEDMKDRILEMIGGEIEDVVSSYMFDEKSRNKDRDKDREENLDEEIEEGPDFDGMISAYRALVDVPDAFIERLASEVAQLSKSEMIAQLTDFADDLYDRLEEVLQAEQLRETERRVLLQAIDNHWVNYLTEMEELREGIGLVAYGQRDPLTAYKTAAYDMWQKLKEQIQKSVVDSIFKSLMAAPQGALLSSSVSVEASGDDLDRVIAAEHREIMALLDRHTKGDDPRGWKLDALKREASYLLQIPPAFFPEITDKDREQLERILFETAQRSFRERAGAALGEIHRGVAIEFSRQLTELRRNIDPESADALGDYIHGMNELALTKREQLNTNMAHTLHEYTLKEVERLDTGLQGPQWQRAQGTTVAASKNSGAIAASSDSAVTRYGGAKVTTNRNVDEVEPLTGQGNGKGAHTHTRNGAASARPSRDGARGTQSAPATAMATAAVKAQKVGPNAPCPCGSGKKYKKCHG